MVPQCVHGDIEVVISDLTMFFAPLIQNKLYASLIICYWDVCTHLAMQLLRVN